MDDLLDDVLNGRAFLDQNHNNTCTNDGDDRQGETTARHRNDGWMQLDWSKSLLNDTTPPSRVDTIFVRDRVVYIKRDDQLRLSGSQISGNKARKMLSINNLHSKDFPQCVVSYGGPQSNAMLAIAAVVHFQNERACLLANDRKRFVYYTKKLPKFLRNQPSGNLFRATSLGMELIELSPQDYNAVFGGDWGGNVDAPPSLHPPVPGKSIWVPQGGACAMALPGTRRLANEIVDFWNEYGKNRPLSVCVPGGTCSTAVLLHHAIQDLKRSSDNDIEVVVVPCVGDEGYAQRQMLSLSTQLGLSSDIPRILPPTPSNGEYFGKPTNEGHNDYFRFGEPDKEILATFEEMKEEHEIVLDLIYGAPSWTIMLRHWRSRDSILADREIMYIHSGGLEGINSQLLRYKHKDLIALDDIQLPGRRRGEDERT